MAYHEISNPTYNANLRKLEPSDPNHADTFNAPLRQLLGNDIALNSQLTQKASQSSLDATNATVVLKADKSEVTNVMTPKGNIAYASLPTSGNIVGWYYYCSDGDGTHGAGNYVWNGTAWYFGGTGDEGYNKLSDDLDNISTALGVEKTILGVEWIVGTITSSGTINPITSVYHTDAVYCKKGYVYKLTNGASFYRVNGYTGYVTEGTPPTIGTTAPTYKPSTEIAYYEAAASFYMSFSVITANIGADIIEYPSIDTMKEILGSIGKTIVNTNTEIITQIQKEVITTQIETVSSGRNAANFGVLPSNTASANTTALQTLLDNGGTIIIDTPGTYLMDNVLLIGSNTSLELGNQVYIKRTNNSNGVIINKGAFTKTYDENIRIKGFHLICDGYNGSTAGLIYGLRGHIGFYYVKNLILEDMVCEDLPNTAFFIHLSNWENVLIDTIRVYGQKDAVHLNRGDGLKICNARFRTFDDPIALNAMDYTNGCPELGSIRNVVIENCVDLSDVDTTGFFARIIAGSWLDWASGKSYRHSDTIVNSIGNVYRLIASTDLTYYTSTVEPTHTSGVIAGVDGIAWRFIQNDAQYSCGCENIVFRDIYLKKDRDVAISLFCVNDAYNRCVYPNSYLPPQKNILLDNVVCAGNINRLLSIQTPVDCLRILNSKIKAIKIADAYTLFDINKNGETYLQIVNSTIKKADGQTDVLGIAVDGDRIIKLNMSGNYNEDSASLTNSGNVMNV